MEPIQKQNTNLLPSAPQEAEEIVDILQFLKEMNVVIQQLSTLLSQAAPLGVSKFVLPIARLIEQKTESFPTLEEKSSSIKIFFKETNQLGKLLDQVQETARSEPLLRPSRPQTAAPQKSTETAIPEKEGSPTQGASVLTGKAATDKAAPPPSAPTKPIFATAIPLKSLPNPTNLPIPRENGGVPPTTRAIQEYLIVVVKTQDNMGKLPEKLPQLTELVLQIPSLSSIFPFLKAPFSSSAKPLLKGSIKEKGTEEEKEAVVSPNEPASRQAPAAPPRQMKELLNQLLLQPPKPEGEGMMRKGEPAAANPPPFALPYFEEKRPIKGSRLPPKKKEKDSEPFEEEGEQTP